MLWVMLTLGVGLVVLLLVGLSVWRQTNWYQKNRRFISARYDYLRAEHAIHAIFQDALRKMTAIRRPRSEQYDPDLGDWKNWLS